VGDVMENQKIGDCIICKLEKAEGLRICEEWICTSCEAEMVHTDVKDPKYSFFIHQLKQVWYKSDAL
jgi:hypothetical protein